MSDSDLYRPIKRIRQACQNCRRKKARCTGERPECAFCVRLGQSCSYSEDESDKQTVNNNERNVGRCELSDLGERLAVLESQMAEVVDTVKSIASTVSTISRSVTSIPTPMPPPHVVPTFDATQSTTYDRLPPPAIIHAAIDLYFRFCHNQPYSLFHEKNLRSKIESDELPTHLVFALLASTVRYSTNPFFNDKTIAVSGYVSQSWKSIVMPWNGIQSEAELSIVKTILLLAIIDFTDGRTQGSWIKVGLAIRLAQDFRLMVEPDPDLDPIQQEERRRVFWSFYLCDKMISCGRERPAVILDDQCKLRLPGDENEWRDGHDQEAPTLHQLDEHTQMNTLSPFAIATVMASLLGKCAQYALGEQEEQTPGEKPLPWNPRSKYSSLHSSLLQIESDVGVNGSLPKKLADLFTNTDGTFDPHRAAPLILAHTIFFLCQCLLYHPFLLRQRLIRLNQRVPQSFLVQTFHSCHSAASALSQLMDDVRSLGCETLSTYYDPFYGYCTVVAGTIHSMFLQSSDPLIVTNAAASFESSMQNLTELSLYWKSCGMMRSRLEDFRASCGKYAQLIDPLVQEIHLTPTDVNDLIECLDYSRMSTTPRKKSEGDAADDIATLSQLPSPFFEEFVNLLPFSYGGPSSSSAFRGHEDVFAQPPQHMYASDLGASSSITYPNVSLAGIMGSPDASDANVQAPALSTRFSPDSTSSYSMRISSGQRETISADVALAQHQQQQQQQNNHLSGLWASSPRMSLKRPWYESSVSYQGAG
ncbi:hypothetical protein K504DRAFT_306967 [Pleomassaria siparia CBS 279.74]|uniref:Zn(2)-C6 fungal-type domain-containing protein n=1 Tax=Pleomassaria siparia CBS 279.74 TaxID=1314801 RepID=A0A6G1K7L8_9PLEO|nr:hypothetical protein K504DRAFT_306967 [Pleomassaria siparia CBS 279.74]